jgi:hypothetical protein
MLKLNYEHYQQHAPLHALLKLVRQVVVVFQTLLQFIVNPVIEAQKIVLEQRQMKF